MPTGTPLNLSETADGWGDVVIKILRDKIARQNIGVSRDLFNSLKRESSGSGNTFREIHFYYNLYGKFVDMGVGRGLSHGNSGNVKTTRRRKEWFSRTFYAQVMRLGELAKQETGVKAARHIVTIMEAVNNKK